MSKEAVLLGVCLVDFHHTRGPEVEYWCGLPEGTDKDNIWPNLPFQALPDGSHSFKETFTYFTLLFNPERKCSPPNGATDISQDELKDYKTLFAISCSRQIRSDELTYKDKDITRSTVQKAIVVISRQPIFGQIKDKLSLVTNAFFLQRDFSDRSIINSLYGNLISLYDTSTSYPQENQFYVGLSLRRIIFDFKKDILILLKAILLEKKMIFYGTNVEALCNLQFGLISLIPNLLSNLEYSGSPQLYDARDNLKPADSFRSSDRQSVLRFLGFPLKVFEKGGLFSPYTPLQQMDDISSNNTNFFVIGSSNSLLTEQKNEFCHIFVDVDESSVEIIDKSLQPALHLTNHDRKWIEYISNMVTETWNENDLFTPKNSQFEGSEDFLRWQFEEYLTGLLSSVKLSDYLDTHKDNALALQSIQEDIVNSNPINFFNTHWVSLWKKTQNYSIFNEMTDDRIFDIFPPKHSYNGIDTLTVIQQKLASTFHSLRKSNTTTSNEKIKEKTVDTVGQDDLSDSVTDNITPATDNASCVEERDQNIWASWKEYFNAKKQKKKNESDSSVKATQHLNNSSSTSVAIGSALIGLGLHLDDDDDTDDTYEVSKDDFSETEMAQNSHEDRDSNTKSKDANESYDVVDQLEDTDNMPSTEEADGFTATERRKPKLNETDALEEKEEVEQ